MKILCSGGAGFLGSHLVERLLHEGHEVTIIDNFQTGSWDNLLFMREQPGLLVRLWEMNVRKLPLDLPVADEWYFDRIYHLACPASPPQYQKNPAGTILTSIEGTVRVLELARATGARVLFTSSSEVYGDPNEHPQTEGYWGHVNCVGPRSSYDEGKRAAEALCYAYFTQHHVDVRIARLFNTFGPRMRPDDGRVVSNFIMQALRGEPLTIFGSGEQTRSLCYVSDTIEALCRLMEVVLGGERKAYFGPTNIGNPGEITMLELAKRIGAAIGREQVGIEHKPLPQDDPARRCPDIGRAKTLLGWEPKVALDEGLKLTVEWFRLRLPGACDRAGSRPPRPH